MSDRLAVIQSDVSVEELKKIEQQIKQLIAVERNLIKTTNEINKSLKTGSAKDYAKAIKEMNSATKEFNKSQMQLANNLTRVTRLERQVAQLLRDQSNAIRDVANATREESRSREAAERVNTQANRTARELANAQAAQSRAAREAANAAAAESRSRQQATREANANSRATRDNNSAHAQLTRQVREARQMARDYGAQIVNLNNGLRNGTISQRDYRDQIRDLERNFRTTTREGNRLQQQLNRLNQATTPSGNRNGSLWGRVTDILKAAGLIKVFDMVTSSIMTLGQYAFSTSVKLNILRLAQLSVFKTQEEVTKQNEFLTKISERYGIEIISLTDAYNKFAASSAGTLLEGAKTQEIFDAVTKSSALLGVSTDETTGILSALGQMMSKGKVQAEELRGQLGDRMAGAFKLFADGMGVSTAQLDKMLKDGEVLADEVLPKFAEQLNKKYTLGIGEDIETDQANLNRITNEWTNFVDSVEQKSGIVSGSINLITTSVVSLLQSLKPSSEITAIEKQQEQFNILGIQLRKNWEDENKRKELIDKMIALNPLFLNGLDKEKATLEDISKRIQDVNAQYVQKLILQEQEEKISELVKDQAENYKDLSKIISENAITYNSFGDATKKALDNFSTGAKNYQQSESEIIISTRAGSEERRKAISILKEMNKIFTNGRLAGFNYVRGIQDGNIAIQEASSKYNDLVNVTNKLFGVQGQLLNMNGLLSKSFQKNGNAVIDRKKEIEEALKIAEGQGKNIALVSNVWREKVNGKWTTTDKKQTEGWFEEFGKIVKRKSATLPDKVKEPKASSSSGVQKDYLKDLQANRDLELAINETKFVKGEQTEKEYLQNVLKINTDFFNKKIAYLKGKNAEERKQKADAILDQSKLEKETQKKIFDIDSGQLEEQNKIKINEFERTSKAIEENQYLTNVDRLNQQIGNDSQMIQQLTSYYDAVLELAKKANQDTLEIERKRDEEIGNIQDKRLGRVNELPGAFNDDIDRISTLSDNLQNQEYEEQRLKILQSKIPLRNEEFLLNRLDLEANKVALLNQRNDLELKKAKLEPLKEANKLTKEQEVQYSEILSGISHINAELDVTEKNLKNLDLSYLLEDLQPLKELIGNGLNDLGLDNVSKQFDDLFNKIVSGTFSARDAVVLAASAMADGLTSMVNRNKENTIASLDEQLAYTQSTTEQEIEFINQRLERLNALDELNAEQIAERNQLEDEARTLKEQQAQREKQIEAQKARAEQKAAAQQALINGALAATMTLAQMGFIAGAIPAALALGFGIAQSIAIMAKDPVPKYRVGRKGGKAEYAITQDGGREFITDKGGNIKSLGSEKGDQMTWLDEGDRVHTANETKQIIKRLGGLPNLGDNVFKKIATQSLIAPSIVINKKEDNSDTIAEKMGKKFDNALRRYTHDTIIKMDGKIYVQRGANHKQQIGYYDLTTGVETYY